MNSLQKASVHPNIKKSNLSFTEACMTAIAVVATLVLQTQSPNSKLTISLEQTLSCLTGCKTSEIINFRHVQP